MKNFEVIDVENNDIYTIKNENDIYTVEMYFYDIENKPKKHDNIYFNENMLKENIELRFGNLESIYGRKIADEDDEDLLILVDEHKQKYVYKRIYG